jgi:hypothetical protein
MVDKRIFAPLFLSFWKQETNPVPFIFQGRMLMRHAIYLNRIELDTE